ncbi:MAG: carboxypeptidase-like regulatory domain-containing protein [Acidobacteria bacterium]|nr:carboxypeptidase-like regulatory domain-containing protein [Acidobacteriota bacterium]
MTVSRAGAAEFGRVSGTVTDTGGKPLMGATVLLAGSGIEGAGEIGQSVERAFTNARGDFSIEHVVPGWYSLQVISPTRLPVLRTGVQVKPDETTNEIFALSGILSRIRWQDPKPRLSSWGNDWKWILRTSGSTRSILRFENANKDHQAEAKHPPLPSKRLIAMLPGPTPGDALASDPGMGTVVAYLHPLDENSDVLVAGSVSSDGIGGSSITTAYRKGLLGKNRQEITLAVHRMNLNGGLPVAFAIDRDLADSEGMVLRYTQTRQLSNALTLTAGVEVQYLSSAQDARTAHPRVSLAYQLDHDTILTLSYGTMDTDETHTLLDRVSDLNAFPRITLRNHRPFLEDATHAELRLERNLGASSRIEVAAYHDAFRDVAVFGIGGVKSLDKMAEQGNVLLEPDGSAAVLNGGQYNSSGGRVAYERDLGNHTRFGVMYAFGDALAVEPTGSLFESAPFNMESLPNILRSEFTQSFSGKLSAHMPGVKTQIITTYTWLPAGRVTMVDPYGQGEMELQPFLGLEVRQPLPKIDALPIRIVAVAAFRNLLGQGSVALAQSNGKPISLTPAYRTVRGGFAVQF